MDSKDTQIEALRPKTVPDGLIAYGTVVAISEIQVKIQITGGIICLIDRLNVSAPFTDLLSNPTKNTSKQPRLSQYFSQGQQYVCKILERRVRKGYAEAQDIIATLDPSCLQEDNIPATLLAIPYVPLQCAIKSIEDHGYQVDIGFKGITGFLEFKRSEDYCRDHNDGKKFLVGQVIRCYTIKPKSLTEFRVVQLTMTESSRKKGEFSRDKVNEVALTDKCILPGSRSFLTVMNVQRSGLIVNFMNEFSGFVSLNHLKDEWHTTKDNYKISQQFHCTVLYYNPLSKQFALSIRGESKSQKTAKYLLEKCHVGQVIKDAEFVSMMGTKSIVFKIKNQYKAVASVKDAIDEDVAIMTKDELHTVLDGIFQDQSRHKCRIKSINHVDQNIVVSLRKDFLKLPFVSVEEIKAGDFIEATVKKIVKDGVIVGFGLNLKAIILDLNLNDTKSIKSYPIGKSVKCRVMKVDMRKQPARVFLTNKESLMDPHITIVDSYDKSFKGETTQATIIKVSPKGLIVELFNNIKGFIPRIFLSEEGIAKTSVESLFQIGQVVSCSVYRVDLVRQSMLLGLIPLAKIMKMKREKKESRKLNKAKKYQAKANGANTKAKILKQAEESEAEDEDEKKEVPVVEDQKVIKSRRQRSEEARLREEKLREAERAMMDPNRPAQSIPDFERLVLKTPNSADAWIKYSKFFLDNIETEKARIVCRRGLKTVSFRMEKEKLKIWLHLINIEARFGGSEKLHEIINEAAQVNDKVNLYKGVAKVLIGCGELEEADRIHGMLLKLDKASVDIWADNLLFLMEHCKDPTRARAQFDKACKTLLKSDLVFLKSKFAQFEFRFGDVERGKTIFENLLSDNPKRTDLWRVYEDMVKKFGTRQVDNEEVREQNEQTILRIAESISLVSRKSPKSMAPREGHSDEIKVAAGNSAKKIKVG